MIGKFKRLSVALLAVIALSAVSVSSASAINYTASTYPVTGTAESGLGNDTFTTEAGNIECQSEYSGSMAAAQPTLTVNATYTKCQAFGFLSASVTMGTCAFEFTEPTKTAADTFSAEAHLRCSGEPITVTAGTCKVTIEEQSPPGSVTAIDDTEGGDVTVQANYTGIEYTVVQDGIGCPFAGTGAKTGATYKQDQAVTVQATNEATIDIG